MKAYQVASVASGLFAFPYQVTASRAEVSRNHISKRDTVPNGPYDPATISTCTFWYDNFEGKSCKVVRDWMYAISAEDFARWNPSVTVDCGNWQELSYCVQVKSEQTSTTKSSVVTTTTSTTTRVSATPTLDSWESLGCYVDSNTLSNHTTKVSGSQLTIEGCESSCWDDSFFYAGVKGGNECWCGSYVGNGWTDDQGDCSLPCGGDASEVCGGSSVFNVFGAKTVDTLPTATATWIPTTTATSTSTTKTSTTTKTTSATAAATPYWQAVGCYRDLYPANARTLVDNKDVSDTSLTIESCQATCLSGGYLYAGVENGRECWCGDMIQSPTSNVPVAEDQCSTRCTGNSNETCGAAAHVYLYKYIEPVTSTPTWEAKGCYRDLYPANARTLVDVKDVSDTSLTIEGCQAKCQQGVYLYAGLENGRECWCGDEIQSPTTNVAVAASECSTKCTGNSTETCGAVARIELYELVVPSVPWVYLGCYGEESTRILTYSLVVPGGNSNLTRENCFNTCQRGGYIYAGLENANECWCDNEIHNGTLATDGSAGCNKACLGDSDELCGGLSRLDMFMISTAA